MLPQPTQELDEKENALAWSFYDYLLATWPEQMGPLFRGLKDGRLEAELFQELFELSLLDIEQGWRAYVGRNYGRKKKSGRR